MNLCFAVIGIILLSSSSQAYEPNEDISRSQSDYQANQVYEAMGRELGISTTEAAKVVTEENKTMSSDEVPLSAKEDTNRSLPDNQVYKEREVRISTTEAAEVVTEENKELTSNLMKVVLNQATSQVSKIGESTTAATQSFGMSNGSKLDEKKINDLLIASENINSNSTFNKTSSGEIGDTLNNLYSIDARFQENGTVTEVTLSSLVSTTSPAMLRDASASNYRTSPRPDEVPENLVDATRAGAITIISAPLLCLISAIVVCFLNWFH